MIVHVYSAFYLLLCLLLVTGVSSLEKDGAPWKRSSSNANIAPLPDYLDDIFQSTFRQSLSKVDTLLRPFLIHTQDGFLVLVNGSQTRNLTISTTVYQNLKMINHLPVSAVSLLLPELLDARVVLTNSQFTSETRQSLMDLREHAENVYSMINSTLTTFFTIQQCNRQQEIIQSVLDFLTKVLDGSIDVTIEYLTSHMKSLSDHLMNNSEDAVLDYLTCLNRTISSLGVPQKVLTEELVVILSADPFSITGSFLHQYYMQLLNINPDSQRIILKPSTTSTNCSASPTDSSYQPQLFDTTLFQSISNIFHNDRFSSLHSGLSQAAAGIICSDNLMLSSCATESAVKGFHTRLEKGYVVLMMIFGGLAVLLGVIVGCITYEDRLMASEMKKQEKQTNFKLEGPNVFTPVSSLQEDQHSTETLSSLLSVNT